MVIIVDMNDLVSLLLVTLFVGCIVVFVCGEMEESNGEGETKERRRSSENNELNVSWP